jgi:hypothetical protein
MGRLVGLESSVSALGISASVRAYSASTQERTLDDLCGHALCLG